MKDASARARASAPATVANVGPCFDVLGLCLESPRDQVTAERTSSGVVEIVAISGDGGKLPREAEDNCIGVVARAVLDRYGEPTDGVRLWLDKGLPLGTGMGSSAASSVAAAMATAAILGAPQDRGGLLDACREGEALASGSPHPDNVAPSLLGGIVACIPEGDGTLDVLALPVPDGLRVVVVRPELRVDTQQARDLLPAAVPLEDAVAAKKKTHDFLLQILEWALDDKIGTLETSGRLMLVFEDADSLDSASFDKTLAIVEPGS